MMTLSIIPTSQKSMKKKVEAEQRTSARAEMKKKTEQMTQPLSSRQRQPLRPSPGGRIQLQASVDRLKERQAALHESECQKNHLRFVAHAV